MTTSRKISLFGLIFLFVVMALSIVAEEPKAQSAFGSLVKDVPSEPGIPLQLKIPTLQIDTSVIKVGLTASGTIGIPADHINVAWYKKSPLPGSVGSSIIVGHYDTKEVKEAVFYNLGKLKKDDLLQIVTDKDQTLTFKVNKIKTYDWDDPASEVFNNSSNKRLLNLITCAGDWLPLHHVYDKRIVVFTELVD